MKRLFDFVVSLIGLIVLSPVMAVIALCIVADSKGGVFFRGERVGRYGKSFRIFGAAYTDMKTGKTPGAVVKADDALVIACADGQCLAITELQAPGKKRMRAADFLRGHKIALS